MCSRLFHKKKITAAVDDYADHNDSIVYTIGSHGYRIFATTGLREDKVGDSSTDLEVFSRSIPQGGATTKY